MANSTQPDSESDAEREARNVAAAEADPRNPFNEDWEIPYLQKSMERLRAGAVDGFGPVDFGDGPVTPAKPPKVKPVPGHKWD